jgi:hypothetical protein
VTHGQVLTFVSYAGVDQRDGVLSSTAENSWTCICYRYVQTYIGGEFASNATFVPAPPCTLSVSSRELLSRISRCFATSLLHRMKIRILVVYTGPTYFSVHKVAILSVTSLVTALTKRLRVFERTSQ